jgi:hypothetical protein
MHWAERRFPKEDFENREDEWRQLMAAFKGV